MGGGTDLKSKGDIVKIFDLLEEHIADEFETQDLDFKEWI
jgi:ATP-dependent DNA helicase RecG